MISLFSDISALTGIPKLTLEKICDKAKLSICDSVLEQLINRDPQTIIDIGVGTLYIRVEDCEIKYKFIPNKDLDKMICTAVSTKNNPLINKLDSTLKERVISTYKELL